MFSAITFQCMFVHTHLSKFASRLLAEHFPINPTKKISITNITFAILILLLGACGGGERSDKIHDNAINAINVVNKSNYRVLSEFRNREPISFNVIENTAFMRGVMDSSIALLMENLLSQYPDIDTIVMQHVLGTLDFEATLKAGKILRSACITTVVPYKGKITSGGVHLFMAGCKRIVESGGQLGIHTWKYAEYDGEGKIIGGKTAVDYPTTDIVHSPYLNYQAEMEIPEDFYWFMANTPFDKMHFLSTEEVEQFNLSTISKKTWGAEYRLTLDFNDPIKLDTARFYVDNGIAIMHGKFTTRTVSDFRKMLIEHPEVHTLEFGYTPGSFSRHKPHAIKLGTVIRENCLTTRISKTSLVLAEATHAFIAGCNLEIESNSVIGLASWVTAEYSEQLESNPKLLELQQLYLDYYDAIGVSHNFYHYQLDMTGPEVHVIDTDTLAKFGII